MRVPPAGSFRGVFTLPGDKSVTHRAYLFGALARGTTVVSGASRGEDCLSTRRCVEALGARVEDGTGEDSGLVRIHGGALRAAPAPLDCGNSGTTMRLLMGLLAGLPGAHELTGDESLKRRPMERVARPLRQMGARITTTEGHAPVLVEGSALTGADITPEAASAQIKGALLLAGLSAQGLTRVREPLATRDHSERMLPLFGARLEVTPQSVSLTGPQTLQGATLRVPGDPSSAAPFVVAALIRPDSEVVIENVLLNPHRTGFIEVLRSMGADIVVEPGSEPAGGDVVGRIIARSSKLHGVTVPEESVPAVVDELPILAVAAAFADGVFVVRGASELRVKESDRIATLAEGLRALGASVIEYPDGFRVMGGPALTGAKVSSHGDHRIAMAMAVAALGASGDTDIEGAEAVAISLPRFFEELRRGSAA